MNNLEWLFRIRPLPTFDAQKQNNRQRHSLRQPGARCVPFHRCAAHAERSACYIDVITMLLRSKKRAGAGKVTPRLKIVKGTQPITALRGHVPSLPARGKMIATLRVG